jgi:hypothetical protein
MRKIDRQGEGSGCHFENYLAQNLVRPRLVVRGSYDLKAPARSTGLICVNQLTRENLSLTI